MTIDELIAATGLTANDEIPIWDAEATGEPTKKITAQQLAAAIVALASLVTSVNGETGAVTLTAEDVNAKATQTPVADPTASGNAVAFIDSISQNAQGVIVPTKKTVPNASTMAPGLMSAADKVKLDNISGEMADKASAIVDTASGAVASFPDGAAVPAKDITIGIEPVQSGSGDPSPTNVRPISGWTGANVTRTGKNLIGDCRIGMTRSETSVWETNAGSNAQWVSEIIKVPENTAITVCAIDKGDMVNGSVNIAFYNSDGAYITNVTAFYFDNIMPITRTYNYADARYIRFYGYQDGGATAINTAKIQVEYGPTASDYEEYQGNTVSVTFPTEAGTVYGGTLDVTTGVLTVTMGIIDLSALSWNIKGSVDDYSTFTTTSPVQYSIRNPPHMMAEQFRYGGYNGSSNNVLAGLASHHDYIYVYWENGATSYFLYANANTVAKPQGKFAVELKNPIIYQLTPVEIEMLLGDNNVWADTGDTTVAYRADTKLYIQKINAPTDDDMIADAQIASGRYFIVGGNLYKSTTTIPAGDTINPGSNCILTNLADALNALNT